jgi:hypothetical protein
MNNTSEWDEAASPEAIEIFNQNHTKDYRLYNYAKSLHEAEVSL